MNRISAKWMLLLLCATLSWLLIVVAIPLSYTGMGPRLLAVLICVALISAWAMSNLLKSKCSKEQMRQAMLIIPTSLALCIIFAILSIAFSFFIKSGDSRVMLVSAGLSPIFILISLNIFKSEIEPKG